MEDEYNYKTNCGQYVLHKGDKPIGPLLDEVSIAFDKESGTLHKHGSREMVERWADNAKSKFRESGFGEMADDIVVITGAFDLNDINRCITTSGYIGVLFARLQKEHATLVDQEVQKGSAGRRF